MTIVFKLFQSENKSYLTCNIEPCECSGDRRLSGDKVGQGHSYSSNFNNGPRGGGGGRGGDGVYNRRTDSRGPMDNQNSSRFSNSTPAGQHNERGGTLATSKTWTGGASGTPVVRNFHITPLMTFKSFMQVSNVVSHFLLITKDILCETIFFCFLKDAKRRLATRVVPETVRGVQFELPGRLLGCLFSGEHGRGVVPNQVVKSLPLKTDFKTKDFS